MFAKECSARTEKYLRVCVDCVLQETGFKNKGRGNNARLQFDSKKSGRRALEAKNFGKHTRLM